MGKPPAEELPKPSDVYKFHVSYPALNGPVKSCFSRRAVMPTLPFDKRCVFQFATRTKSTFKRIHSHTMVGSNFSCTLGSATRPSWRPSCRSIATSVVLPRVLSLHRPWLAVTIRHLRSTSIACLRTLNEWHRPNKHLGASKRPT